MGAVIASPQQVNLFNPALLPARQRFTAHQLGGWVAFAIVALAAVAWWATMQLRQLREEIAEEQARRPAHTAQGPAAQEVAALDQSLRGLRAQLEARRAALEALQRGMAGTAGGPAGVMRRLSATIPPSVWLQDVNVNGARIDIKARTLEPSAVEAWLEHMRATGLLAERPAATLHLDRIDAAAAPAGAPVAYAATIGGMLAQPFAEGGRP